MANYTTADIKALREKTGAGMLDVKKALDEANGDAEKAIEIIRVKGLKGIAKREGRAASAGLIAAKVVDSGNGQVGVLVEINAETDFVAKNQKFLDYAEQVLTAALDSGATDAEALAEVEAVGGQGFASLLDEAEVRQVVEQGAAHEELGGEVVFLTALGVTLRGGGPVIGDLIDDGSGQTLPHLHQSRVFNGASGGRTHVRGQRLRQIQRHMTSFFVSMPSRQAASPGEGSGLTLEITDLSS